MSEPTHPIYTFRANLQTLNFLNNLQPDLHNSDPDLGRESADNHKTSRSTWLPGLTAGENRVLKHDGELTVNGLRAKYLKDTFTTGEDPILEIVT